MIVAFPRASSLRLSRPLVLVGLMGAGKTTVGRRLAQKLRVEFCDADDEIEAAANMRISEFFDSYGEAAFREGERKVIARLLDGPPHVLATGGGAFMNDETRALMKEKATSIWLKADLDLLVARTSRRNHRPLLRHGDARQILSTLMAQREPVYAEADLTVKSLDGPHGLTVDRILEALEQRERADGRL